MSSNLSQIDMLARLLTVSALRHRVTAQNVANVDTPGYQRLEVSFEGELAAARGEATGVRPTVVASDKAPVRPDGNNVSIDDEMGILNKNTLLYQAAAQLLSTRLAMQRAAVTGR